MSEFWNPTRSRSGAKGAQLRPTNGHEVSTRGRIPAAIIEAYENRGVEPAAAVNGSRKVIS